MELVLLTAVGAAMIAGGVFDAMTLEIPNWVSGVLLILFPIVVLSSGVSWPEALTHFGVGFAVLLAGMALFAGGFVGGGDAKLFAAASLYAGAAWFGTYVFAVALAGGVLAFAVIGIRVAAAYGLGPWLSGLQEHFLKGRHIPYGIAIAAGGLFVLPQTHLFFGA